MPKSLGHIISTETKLARTWKKLKERIKRMEVCWLKLSFEYAHRVSRFARNDDRHRHSERSEETPESRAASFRA